MSKSRRTRFGKTSIAEPFLQMIGFVTAKLIPHAIETTVAAPLHRIAMILRTQAEQNLEKPVTGIIDCTFRISNEEGPQSFWKGNLLTFLLYLPERMISYLLRNYHHRILTFFSYPRTKYGFGLYYLANIVGATASATLMTIFYYPASYVYIYTADIGNNFTGIADLYKKVTKSEGLLGLYCGMELAIAGVAVHLMLYFGQWELMKTLISEFPSLGNSNLLLYCASYLITLTSMLAIYPLDTIRFRMMMRCATKGKYSNAYQVAKQIIAEEGWTGLWAGAMANLLKVLIVIPVRQLYLLSD